MFHYSELEIHVTQTLAKLSVALKLRPAGWVKNWLGDQSRISCYKNPGEAYESDGDARRLA